MLYIKAGISKMLVRIANREDPDQTASFEAVWSGSALLVPFLPVMTFVVCSLYVEPSGSVGSVLDWG